MMKHLMRSTLRIIFPLYGMCLLLGLLGATTAQSATYYVAPTGNDSNPGTLANPWQNPQKCVAAGSPLVAGDTCIVKDGIYKDIDANGVVVYASDNSVSGTASYPITIKSESPHGATIIVSSADNNGNSGFYITRPYYVIEGFKITGGANPSLTASHNGIVFTANATGGIARSNEIHHIGRTVCSDSPYGYDGILIAGTSGVIVENNLIYGIGRLRNGENGCTTIRYQNDHGVYIEGASNITVRRNIIYDTNRGWPIHVYKSGGTTTNLKIYHNTFAGKSPTGLPVGHIILASQLTTANIANNISYDALRGMVYCSYLTASGVTVSFNLSDTLANTGSDYSGVTFSNNLELINPNFADPTSSDFHLNPGSPAINAGTTFGVPAVTDGAPDIGAYEKSAQSTLLAPQGLRIQ